jgi:hypothetical protein
MKKVILLATVYLISLSVFSQGTYVPLGGDTYDYIDRLDVRYGEILPILHTSTKPYIRSEVAPIAETLHFSNLQQNKVNTFQLQYLMDDSPEWLDSLSSKTRKPLFGKLYREPASFAHVESKKKGEYDLRINPIIDLHLGAESQNSRFVFNRAAGLEFRGNIKKVLSFYVSVTGNDARLPLYVANKTSEDISANNYHDTVPMPQIVGQKSPNRQFLPGQAYYKVYSSSIFKFNDGVDWFDARGYVNANVLKYLNITFGRDKHFWGDGQRSLFLSDYSAPMLFLKYKLTFWRIEYVSMTTQLTSAYSRGGDQLIDQKYGSFHKVDFKLTHWLNMGIFESVISRRNGNNLDPSYMNPIIFYRSVEHALGSPDNVFLGAYFKANAAEHLSFYGQALFDEFNFGHFFKGDGWWANKWGLQLGMKAIDIAPNLDGQIEFNMVRPFTYTHNGEDNYTNYNQPLAHPLGANFYEVLTQLHYQPMPKLAFNMKLILAKVGDDTINGIKTYQVPDSKGVLQNVSTPVYSNFGGDILRTDPYSKEFGNSLAQGVAGTIAYFDLVMAYQAWHNIYLDVEAFYRNKSSSYKAFNESTFYLGVGVRLNIAAKKYEF